MSQKESSEKPTSQPGSDTLHSGGKNTLAENVLLSHPQVDLAVHSKTSVLPILPSVVINPKPQPKLYGDTRPIPSAVNLQPESIQSEISVEEYSSPSSSQQTLIEKLVRFVQHGFIFWRNVFSDSFRWQIFKSLLLFAVGLKISQEYYNWVNSTTMPSFVNDRQAWLERCRKHKERNKEVKENSTLK